LFVFADKGTKNWAQKQENKGFLLMEMPITGCSEAFPWGFSALFLPFAYTRMTVRL
jgi:hypothetical protein